MRERSIRTAKAFDILDRCQSFEKAVLSIDGVEFDAFSNGVDFDLEGFNDRIRYVIIVPRYDFHKGYAGQIAAKILEVAKAHGLRRTEDAIEDYGEHIYMVLRGW